MSVEETETTLTQLQRWARENGMPLAPNALRSLRNEDVQTAEQAALLPDSALLSMPWFKSSSLRALRTWQAGRGIPVTPDPEPLPDAGENGGERRRQQMIVVAPQPAPYQTLVWPPQNEVERFAWETYIALITPRETVVQRLSPKEAIISAWSAAEAWQREKRASAERVKAEAAAEEGPDEALDRGESWRMND